jgi:hypothetical protein
LTKKTKSDIWTTFSEIAVYDSRKPEIVLKILDSFLPKKEGQDQQERGKKNGIKTKQPKKQKNIL